MSQENIELVRRIDEAFANEKMEDFYALCDENIVWKMAGNDPIKGLSAIRQWMSKSADTKDHESPSINNNKMIADENSVAAYGEMTMKINGVLETYDYCDLYQFSNGKVTQLVSFVTKQNAEGAENSAAA